jgi:hypothetical protein
MNIFGKLKIKKPTVKKSTLKKLGVRKAVAIQTYGLQRDNPYKKKK